MKQNGLWADVKTKMFSCFSVFVFCAFLSCCQGMDLLNMPLHASCKVDWTFAESCDIVNQKLADQIQAWSGPVGCQKGGEKCLYEMTSNKDSVLKGKHTTPKKGYTDSFSFTFTSAAGGLCAVQGKSSSDTWYAVLDSGTNYCNLHNLITGAQLDKSPGYTERTSNSVCTQYSSADCEKY